MRMFLTMAALIPMAAAAAAPDYIFRVKVSVSAPSGQQEIIMSQITRELRKLPHVEVVSSEELFGISVVCVPVAEYPMLACGIDYTTPSNLDDVKRPKQLIVLLQTVRIIGLNRIATLAADAVDSLNGGYLEPTRQAIEALPDVKKP